MALASVQLQGSYSSQLGSQEFSQRLPTLSPTPSTKDTTVYLGALRKAAVQMQANINIFLTKKMDEDNQNASARNGLGASKIDETKDEEFYGEEQDDGDDDA